MRTWNKFSMTNKRRPHFYGIYSYLDNIGVKPQFSYDIFGLNPAR